MTTLFDKCILFLSQNIAQVESFEGFPEQIAVQIFESCIKNEAFSVPISSASKIMSKFSEAYPEKICDSVSLKTSSSSIVLALFPVLNCLHVSLTVINFNDCELGDDHPVLETISTSKSLKELALRNNCLTDDGLRRLSLPSRVLKSGLLPLEVLDISDNPGLTDKNVSVLLQFKTLRAVNLTGTSITDAGYSRLQKSHCMHERSISEDNPISSLDHVVARGWAAPVIEKWIKELEEKEKKEMGTKRCGPEFFYRNKARRFSLDVQLSMNQISRNASQKNVRLKESILVATAEDVRARQVEKTNASSKRVFTRTAKRTLHSNNSHILAQYTEPPEKRTCRRKNIDSVFSHFE